MTEKKKEVKKPLTAEELKAIKDARTLARKEDLERALALDARLPKMSFRQVRGKLRQEARRPSDTSPLTSALATILLMVLENTKTRENPFAKLEAYPR